MTPEGRVKKVVSTYLKELQERYEALGHDIYFSMFVPVGYGKRNTLDYTLCFAGIFVAIETKAPGKKSDLTPLQRETCRNIWRSGGKVFIISGPEGLDAFKRWVANNEYRLANH